MKLRLNMLLGAAIGVVFIYLAFRNVNFSEMVDALQRANYWWLFPALSAMTLSHWVRAMRWRYFLLPAKDVKVRSLFSALLIGYAANNVLPLRLGEFLRAYAVGRTDGVSKSFAFATVVVERLVDVLSMLVVFAVTIFFVPLPENIKETGFSLFLITGTLIVLLGLLSAKPTATLSAVRRLLPARVFEKVHKVLHSFLEGLGALRATEHYLKVIGTTVLMWGLYAVAVYVSFWAFDFVRNYQVDFFASFVVLIMVSIGLMIPSPGSVGPYHFFCKMALLIYAVSAEEAMSFAIVSHAMNMVPFTALGLLFFWKQNLHFSDAMAEKEMVAHELAEEPALDDTEEGLAGETVRKQEP